MTATPYFTEYEELRIKYPKGSKWSYKHRTLIISIVGHNLRSVIIRYEDGSFYVGEFSQKTLDRNFVLKPDD